MTHAVELETVRNHLLIGGTIDIWVHPVDIEGNHAYEESTIKGWATWVQMYTPDDPEQDFECLLDTTSGGKEEAELVAMLLSQHFFGETGQWEVYT